LKHWASLTFSGGDIASLAENSKKVAMMCMPQVHTSSHLMLFILHSNSFYYHCYCYLLPIESPYSGTILQAVKLSQPRFNITSPNKPKLAMELIFDMDTHKKVPLVRELVKGCSTTIFIETRNNQQKRAVNTTFQNAQVKLL
jgi:hypothetical protein